MDMYLPHFLNDVFESCIKVVRKNKKTPTPQALKSLIKKEADEYIRDIVERVLLPTLKANEAEMIEGILHVINTKGMANIDWKTASQDPADAFIDALRAARR